MKLCTTILLSGLALSGCAPDESTKAAVSALEKRVAAFEALQKAPTPDPVVAKSQNDFPVFDDQHSITLTAGQSVILARGQTAKVPAGTVIIQPGPNANGFNIQGQRNTVNAGAGVIVCVSIDASGAADNLVTAK